MLEELCTYKNWALNEKVDTVQSYNALGDQVVAKTRRFRYIFCKIYKPHFLLQWIIPGEFVEEIYLKMGVNREKVDTFILHGEAVL